MNSIEIDVELIEQVVSGVKTQARFPVEGITGDYVYNGFLHKLKSKKMDGEAWFSLKPHKRLNVNSLYISYPYGIVGDILSIDRTEHLIKVVDIRIERVQDISEQDSIAEGAIESVQWESEEAKQSWLGNEGYAKGCYRHIWDSVYAKEYPWTDNPCVWVIEFEYCGGA